MGGTSLRIRFGALSFILLLMLVQLCQFLGTNLAEATSFDPFMDSNLFAISWLGPLDLNPDEISDLGDRHLVVTTNKKETYRCILPETSGKSTEDAENYEGLDVDEIMRPLFQQEHCSYRIESFWTYELCHGKSLKQYHETREHGSKPKMQTYFLGMGNSRTQSSSSTLKVKPEGQEEAAEPQGHQEESTASAVPVREIEGVQLPYYEVVMDDGSRCDLTGQPRKSRVMYICQPEGRGEIYEFKESSTCEYEVLVLSALLCKHPSYRPKTQPVNQIRCHAMVGSPLKPSELSRVEHEVHHLQSAPLRYATVQANEDEAEGEEEAGKPTPYPHSEEDRLPPKGRAPPAARKVQEDPQAALSALTDRQTIHNILTGSQCLRGGSGWWKHEVCIGKFVKQFHKDKNVDAHIYLGYWDQEKHLQWLIDHPSKRPKPAKERKFVSLFYTDGDVCDITGEPRNCEIRLKCLQTVKKSHAVVLSMSEPHTCHYVLTIESALFCDVLQHADENGMFDHIDL